MFLNSSQEHGDLSQVISIAYANEFAAGHIDTDQIQLSLISKLHHLLGSLRHASTAHQRAIEDKMCQQLMKARQLAEGLSKETSCSTNRSKIPEIAKGERPDESASAASRLPDAGGHGNDGLLGRRQISQALAPRASAAAASAAGNSLMTTPQATDQVYGKLRSRVALLESIVEKIILRKASSRTSTHLVPRSSSAAGSALGSDTVALPTPLSTGPATTSTKTLEQSSASSLPSSDPAGCPLDQGLLTCNLIYDDRDKVPSTCKTYGGMASLHKGISIKCSTACHKSKEINDIALEEENAAVKNEAITKVKFTHGSCTLLVFFHVVLWRNVYHYITYRPGIKVYINIYVIAL